MDWREYIKNRGLGGIDHLHRIRLRNREIRKFKHPKRKVIHDKIALTKSQKSIIDDIYITNYGEKIPYTWHRHFTAYTGNFDPYYFPELLFIPEFEHFMNSNRHYAKSFSDKNVQATIAAAANIKMPKDVLSCSFGIYKDGFGNILNVHEAVDVIKNKGVLFAKPSVDTSSGIGCRLLHMQGGIDQQSQHSATEIFAKLGNNFVIQERLVCHDSIRKIYANSVNTFRVITYRWLDEIRAMPVIIRIGQGGKFLDNAHAGGLFIGVGPEGQLHKTAFTEFKDEYTNHPDTNIRFENCLIHNFPQVVTAAKRMHYFIPQLGCINWDLTIDVDANPVLIEANIMRGSIWLPEMAHGVGGFGEHTPEVLRWIRQMKNMNFAQREQYSFGRMK